MGGSNDLRAWYARSVGPGSYVLDEQTLQLRNYYQHGDIKLLINAELRHGLIWRLKGALLLILGTYGILTLTKVSQMAPSNLIHSTNKLPLEQAMVCDLISPFLL
jgi:hypothetical protein